MNIGHRVHACVGAAGLFRGVRGWRGYLPLSDIAELYTISTAFLAEKL